MGADFVHSFDRKDIAMSVRLLRIALVGLATTVSVPSHATMYVFGAALSGLNEATPNASPGTGAITVTADDSTFTINVVESFSGLTSNATGAHIHCCAAIGSNAPIFVPFTGFPTTTSGSYSNIFDLSSFTTLLSGLQSGLAYANIHTATFPGGEIRGQLTAVSGVPEPTSWAMMIVGFGAIGVTLRRRQKVSAHIHFA